MINPRKWSWSFWSPPTCAVGMETSRELGNWVSGGTMQEFFSLQVGEFLFTVFDRDARKWIKG